LGIDWGLEMARYWLTTPKEYSQYIEAYTKIEEGRAREMDYNNFNLGKYIAYAFHDPKKYPKQPFLKEGENIEKKDMTGEQMDKRMRRNTIILGGTLK